VLLICCLRVQAGLHVPPAINVIRGVWIVTWLMRSPPDFDSCVQRFQVFCYRIKSKSDDLSCKIQTPLEFRPPGYGRRTRQDFLLTECRLFHAVPLLLASLQRCSIPIGHFLKTLNPSWQFPKVFHSYWSIPRAVSCTRKVQTSVRHSEQHQPPVTLDIQLAQRRLQNGSEIHDTATRNKQSYE